MFTESQFIDCAKTLRVEVAAVKAVAKVEGNSVGMINGRPIILFEPHVFWKELRRFRVNPEKLVSDKTKDILYPNWGARPYPKTQDARYDQLDRASKLYTKDLTISRAAALRSASWGAFQILGNNYELCDCPSLQQFVNSMYHSEDQHLKLFTSYIKNTYLDDELRALDWKAFARAYNGPLYWKHAYDVKLRVAYNKFKALG